MPMPEFAKNWAMPFLFGSVCGAFGVVVFTLLVPAAWPGAVEVAQPFRSLLIVLVLVGMAMVLARAYWWFYLPTPERHEQRWAANFFGLTLAAPPAGFAMQFGFNLPWLEARFQVDGGGIAGVIVSLFGVVATLICIALFRVDYRVSHPPPPQ